MKAVITGSTSQSGQILMENIDLDWVPVDRTNGYTLPDDCDKLIEHLVDADIFFNLASIGTLQSSLLAYVWDFWNRQEPQTTKKIINFGSLVTELDIPNIVSINQNSFFDRPREKNNYIAEKLLLKKTHEDYKRLHLQQHIQIHLHKDYENNYTIPQSILLQFGNIMYKSTRKEQPYTSAEELLEIVNFAISCKSYISEYEVRWN